MLSETLTLLGNGRHGEHAIHIPYFLLGVECCRLFGDLYFNMLHVCMLFTMDGCMCVDACTCIFGMNGKNPCRMNNKGVHALKEGSRSLHDGEAFSRS